jgi:3-methylfumaryl-CoA hydratase
MTVEIEKLQEWIGKSESRTDLITPVPVMALSTTLDHPAPGVKPGDPLPPLWHWLYFLPIYRQSELGPDGHPLRGGFLPPVHLRRRMWAGSRLEFRHPIRVGERIMRTSLIADVRCKQGRNGALVFVTVRHEIHNTNRREIALIEEQDIVYRDSVKAGDPATSSLAAPELCSWRRNIRPDEVMLFRYSALTFNGHRIHYDRRFATETEGYPGLVVHGPLVATLMLDLLRRNLPHAVLSRFDYRALRPLFDTSEFSVCGRLTTSEKTVELWAQDGVGAMAMQATATLL